MANKVVPNDYYLDYLKSKVSQIGQDKTKKNLNTKEKMRQALKKTFERSEQNFYSKA